MVGYGISALLFLILGFLTSYLMGIQLPDSPASLPKEEIDRAIRATLISLTPSPTPLPTDVPIALTYSDRHHSIGNSNAPVKFVEFADYQCRFCSVFALINLEQIMEIYNGYVQFIYRDFPVLGYGTDPNMSIRAAHYAACAARQDFYWNFHQAVWEQQQAGRISEEALMAVAQQLPLDMDNFETCLDDESIVQAINADFSQALGLLGDAPTPTFFINGKRYQGFAPLEVFMQRIDEALIEMGIQPPNSISH